MATPKYYLDQAGLEALVAKIKQLHNANASEITRIIVEIIGVDETATGTLREQIASILSRLEEHAGNMGQLAGLIEEVDDAAQTAVYNVDIRNSVPDQQMTFTFTDKNKNVIGEPIVIDTSEFIVNGILQDSQVVTGDKFYIEFEDVLDPETGKPMVDENTGDPLVEPKVKCTGKNDEKIDVIDNNVISTVYPNFPEDIDDEDRNDKAQFLLLTFGVKPEYNDGSEEESTVHTPEAQYAWVNLGSLISSYVFHGDGKFIDVDQDFSTNNVTITFTNEFKQIIGEGGLKDTEPNNTEYAEWDLMPVDDGLRARVEWLEYYAANKPISVADIDGLFNGSPEETDPIEPTPYPTQPDEPAEP